jgi:serine/threonine-protein kinase
MSVVYRALDERLHRPVCAKVFFGLDRSQALYQTTYDHFIQEAFALSQLQHPNTLRIYDFGYLEEEPRSPYHVSELMDGGTLLGHIRRHGAMAPMDVVAVLDPIVGALAEAHGRGIIHRDIKPSNILFGNAGGQRITKLADFGIAKANLDEAMRSIPNRAQDTQAAAGMRVSLYSPGWAAPEQLRAQPVGPTADVYALGLLTAFMLSGRKLFAEQDVAKNLEQRSEGDAYVMRAIDDLAVPSAFVELLRHSCRTSPADRPQSAAEFLIEARKAAEAKEDSVIETERFERAAIESDVPPIKVPLGDGEFQAGKRLMRVIPARSNQLDFGGPNDLVKSPARLRVSLIPDHERGMVIHLRGLNCFLLKAGRPTSAIEVDGDQEVELVSISRDRIDAVRVAFGHGSEHLRIYQFSDTAVAVPHGDAIRSVMLDFGPGRELVLVYVRRG